MSDRRQFRRRLPRGTPRPIMPEWQLSQREVWAMLSRPHFTRFAIARVVRRQVFGAAGPAMVRKVVS